MKDEILEEVWKAKDALAAKYNYDIHAMFRDLREREKTSGAKYVRLKPRKLKVAGKRTGSAE
ncbi:MAG: hypothetical protein HZA90_18170 [Verrucomicrobia bacterium]|nr:hypothetical protein [Verrucomicrobiota bacterium]